MSDATYSQTSKISAPVGGGLPMESPEHAAGFWGRVLVAVSACVLTVSIVGSAAFLWFRIQERRELRTRVQGFIASLENRTDAELADRAAQLRGKPKVAEYVLPEIRRALRASRSEDQLCAVIRLCEAFVDRREIETALFELRGDRREVVAGAAVDALAKVQPAERAAELLGQVLAGAASGETVPAGVDSACAGLFRLGAAGRAEIEKRLESMTVDRRLWLVKYVNEVGGPYRESWLTLLGADTDAGVREAVARARVMPEPILSVRVPAPQGVGDDNQAHLASEARRPGDAGD